jgi:hypothetical protein
MKSKLMLVVLGVLAVASVAEAKMKALIIDGQNNHVVWPKGTVMMKQYLEDTGLFEVKVCRTAYTWHAEREQQYLPLAGVGKTEDLDQPKPDPAYNPSFKDYDVVISNFGNSAAPWPEATQKAFEDYVRNGGGFVSVHAADNSFGDWRADPMFTIPTQANWSATQKQPADAASTGRRTTFRLPFASRIIPSPKAFPSIGSRPRTSVTPCCAARRKT